MAAYNIALDGNVLKIGFGTPAQNNEIVVAAKGLLDDMIADGTIAGGDLVKINGPASLPVACVIAHAVAHLYGAVAVFDPKLGSYVVAISHNPDHAVGDLVS